jgi:hypothetical protein
MVYFMGQFRYVFVRAFPPRRCSRLRTEQTRGKEEFPCVTMSWYA